MDGAILRQKLNSFQLLFILVRKLHQICFTRFLIRLRFTIQSMQKHIDKIAERHLKYYCNYYSYTNCTETTLQKVTPSIEKYRNYGISSDKIQRNPKVQVNLGPRVYAPHPSVSYLSLICACGPAQLYSHHQGSYAPFFSCVSFFLLIII